MADYTRKTTIEQIVSRAADGTPYCKMLEIVTSHAIPDMCADSERQEVEDFVDTLHDAQVALASLEPDHRERAEEWLDDHDVDAESEAAWIRQAIEVTQALDEARLDDLLALDSIRDVMDAISEIGEDAIATGRDGASCFGNRLRTELRAYSTLNVHAVRRAARLAARDMGITAAPWAAED